MLFLYPMTPNLGGFLTPQTPPGADGKEDFCLVKKKKHYLFIDNVFENYDNYLYLCWKFQKILAR